MRPSSHTTMLATLSVPWMCEMSKHSMRRGASGRFRASCSASLIASDDGFITRNRWSKLFLAFASTSSIMAFFSPRCGRMNVHPAAAFLREQFFQQFAVFEIRRDVDRSGNVLLLQINLLQQ